MRGNLSRKVSSPQEGAWGDAQRREVFWSGENPNAYRNGLLFQSLSTPAASCGR